VRLTSLGVGIVLVFSTATSAQSLADAARKAAEARAKVADPAKTEKADARAPVKTVYTNEDLKDSKVSALPATATTTATAPAIASPVSPTASSESDVYKATARQDEAYWKNRRRDLQASLDADEISLIAMTGRVAALTADFNGSNSISHRAAIRSEREAAATELSRIQAAIVIDRRAIATLEEEARRANVPAGWLRP
jgi:hypothetical protein